MRYYNRVEYSVSVPTTGGVVDFYYLVMWVRSGAAGQTSTGEIDSVADYSACDTFH